MDTGGESVAWAVHPKWDLNPNNSLAEYDIGIGHLNKDPTTGKYVDEVIEPIRILSNQNITRIQGGKPLGMYSIRTAHA